MLTFVLIVKFAASGFPLDNESWNIEVKKMASMVFLTGISLRHSVLISNVIDCLNSLSFLSSVSEALPIVAGLTIIPTS